MKTLAEFEKYFKNEFSTNRKLYNKGLKKAEKVANIFRIASVAFGIIFSIVMVVLALCHFQYIYVMCVFGVIVFCILLGFSFYDMFIKEEVKERFENEDKPTLVSNILEKDFEYMQKGRISAQDIRESKMMPKFDETDGEDFVKINCNESNLDVEVTFSDVILKELVQDSDRIDSKDIFSGFYLVADFGKDLHFDIDVNIEKTKGMVAYSTESALFNENFTVWCKETDRAEKLFGAGVMLSMLNLKLTTGGNMKMRLRGNKMYLCIDKELFAFNLEKKVDFESVRNMYDELAGIDRLVREMAKRYERYEIEKK